MRKFVVVFAVMVALMITAVAVSATTGRPNGKVPSDIATLVENGVICPNVNTARDNWGNATHVNSKGELVISGLGVQGHCVVSTQGIINSVCRAGQVNTSRPGWGNASHVQADGDLVISGRWVAGRCEVPAGPVAEAVKGLIPKFR